ncbi:hypothetical protein ACMFMF_003794 [Clarireedia jacksonii]
MLDDDDILEQQSTKKELNTKMSVTIKAGEGAIIRTKPLSQDAFSSFGTVIQNPAPAVNPSTSLKELPPNAVQANQGSAIKYQNVTQMKDFYHKAPSRRVANAVMNMFVCSPRALRPSHESNIGGLFPVRILERHPFTTQTFIPLGISPSEQKDVCYLVVVAPSLPPSSIDETLPVPKTGNDEKLPRARVAGLEQAPGFHSEWRTSGHLQCGDLACSDGSCREQIH